MTQQSSSQMANTDKAWSRIHRDEWSQMAWFIKLANAPPFEGMTPGEQLVWEEEFVAIYLVTRPVIPVPLDPKRYPRSPEIESSGYVAHLPAPAQMQEVRSLIAQHLNDLADDKSTVIGGFSVTLTISFHRNPSYQENSDLPRYLMYRGESGEATNNIYRMPLLLYMANLLEKKNCDFATKVRRCKLCKHLFLQRKRSAQYCGPKCYTVGCMREFRAAEKIRKHKLNKKDVLAIAKGGSKRGKKRG